MGGSTYCYFVVFLPYFVVVCNVFLHGHTGAATNTIVQEDAMRDTSEELIIETTYGAVRGVDLNEARAFLGIPYASPPTGNLRWQPPQEPGVWRPEVYEAIVKPPGCPQICSEPLYVCPEKISEDCLYLNIFTPLDASLDSNLPVIVYIHGGRFETGSASSLPFDGRFIANMSSAVVVTINYRLGALGWLVLGRDTPVTGNYGFLDQVAALKFVRNNIASFGGNPEKVTLFGQDAGTNSIAIHLANSESDELFQQTILQSTILSVSFNTPKQARVHGNRFKSLLKCNSLACMKNRPVGYILRAQNSEAFNYSVSNLHNMNAWSPVIDGSHVFMNTLTSFLNSRIQTKPMIFGITSEETRRQVYRAFSTEPAYPVASVAANLIFSSHASAILRKYGIHWFSTQIREPLTRATGDYLFVCPTSRAAQSMAALDNPVYHYVFDHGLTFTDAWGSYKMCKGHACHGSETLLDFHTASLVGLEYGQVEEILVNRIVDYFGNFAHTSNPNDGSWRLQQPVTNLQEWPLYKDESHWQSLVFQTPQTFTIKKYREDKCTFWDTIGLDVSSRISRLIIRN